MKNRFSLKLLNIVHLASSSILKESIKLLNYPWFWLHQWKPLHKKRRLTNTIITWTTPSHERRRDMKATVEIITFKTRQLIYTCIRLKILRIFTKSITTPDICHSWRPKTVSLKQKNDEKRNEAESIRELNSWLFHNCYSWQPCLQAAHEEQRSKPPDAYASRKPGHKNTASPSQTPTLDIGKRT